MPSNHRGKKKKSERRDNVREHILDVLSWEESMEAERQRFKSSFYWDNTLLPNEKDALEHLFDLERDKTNDLLVELMDAYRPLGASARNKIDGYDGNKQQQNLYRNTSRRRKGGSSLRTRKNHRWATRPANNNKNGETGRGRREENVHFEIDLVKKQSAQGLLLHLPLIMPPSSSTSTSRRHHSRQQEAAFDPHNNILSPSVTAAAAHYSKHGAVSSRRDESARFARPQTSGFLGISTTDAGGPSSYQMPSLRDPNKANQNRAIGRRKSGKAVGADAGRRERFGNLVREFGSPISTSHDASKLTEDRPHLFGIFAPPRS